MLGLNDYLNNRKQVIKKINFNENKIQLTRIAFTVRLFKSGSYKRTLIAWAKWRTLRPSNTKWNKWHDKPC